MNKQHLEAEQTAPPAQVVENKTPPEEALTNVEELLAVLRTESEKRQKRSRYYVIGIMGAFGLLCIAGLVVYFIKGHFPGDLFTTLSSFAGCAGVAAAVSQTQKDATAKLTEVDDVRAVGWLAEALQFGDKKLRWASLVALSRLLPRLTAQDKDLLNANQLHILCKEIARRRPACDLEVGRAILHAFEQTADELVVRTIRRLSEQTSDADPRHRAIAEAAQEALPRIESSAERNRVEQSLLRPSQAVDDPSTTLVRPASLTPADETLLLRPTNSTDQSNK
jgi:hypothetical protein